MRRPPAKESGRLKMVWAKIILMVIIFISFVADGYFLAVGQEDILTLDNLLEIALKNNPEILSYKKKLEAAWVRVPRAKSLDEPSLGLEFEQIPRGSLKLNKADKMYSFSQLIPFPGKLSLKGEIALKEAQMVAAEYKDTQLEVASEVKKAYYQYFMLDKKIIFAKENKIFLENLEKISEAKYIVGEVSQQDVFKAQSELAQQTNEIMNLEREKESVQVKLNTRLNYLPDKEIKLNTEFKENTFTYGLDDLYIMALENKPELAMFNYALERSRSDYKLAKRELLPDLSTMFTLRDPAMGAFGAYDILMAINLPFWFWSKKRYEVKEALINIDVAEAAYQNMKNKALLEVKEMWVMVDIQKRSISLYKTTIIPLARSSLNSSLAGYRGGKVDFLSVLDNQRELIDAQINYYSALAKYEQSLADLERTVGVMLTEKGE